MTPTHASPLQQTFTAVRDTLTAHLSFTHPLHADLGALWAIGTHAYTAFDAYPYLVITAATKRAGKSIFAEVLSFASRQGAMGTSMSASVLRRLVSKGATLFFDEAESLNSEAASTVREFLNVGYRAGQKVYMPSPDNPDDVIAYDAYSPKAFCLIGDVNDTLRDRSIVIEMQRGTPGTIYRRRVVEAELLALTAGFRARVDEDGAALTVALLQAIDDAGIFDAYDVLSDREAEIWTPIFTLARLLCPHAMRDLIRLAVDLSALKQTTDKKRFSAIRKNEEEKVANAAFAERAMRDLHAVFVAYPKATRMFTEDILDAMKGIDVAPWRTYKGTGLTGHALADLVNTFCASRSIKSGGKVKRGYQRADVDAGFKKLAGTK